MTRRAAKTDFPSAFHAIAAVTVNGVHPRCNEFDACALIDPQQGRSARKSPDASTDIEARAFSRRSAFNQSHALRVDPFKCKKQHRHPRGWTGAVCTCVNAFFGGAR